LDRRYRSISVKTDLINVDTVYPQNIVTQNLQVMSNTIIGSSGQSLLGSGATIYTYPVLNVAVGQKTSDSSGGETMLTSTNGTIWSANTHRRNVSVWRV
jgi:hypothetical protein